MADTPQAVEVNCETGEVTYRNLTAEEIAAQAAAAQAAADQQAAADAEAAAVAAAKASANAKLKALGLSDEEISALSK
jgi:DNA-binding transcriptional regulator YhcF (GntR family)